MPYKSITKFAASSAPEIIPRNTQARQPKGWRASAIVPMVRIFEVVHGNSSGLKEEDRAGMMNFFRRAKLLEQAASLAASRASVKKGDIFARVVERRRVAVSLNSRSSKNAG
ncbi:hypothetical protein [Mesorhizobium cantuariense]|uniref:Uncharacterized protein n=1 Tax=Mesorhizobium cantuariense TaxID=1300275 RepID=A0ABV7MYM6_9HYPH